MSGKTRLHNPGQFEQVIDYAGHVLAGGESRTVTATDAFTDQLVERGVILATVPEPSLIRGRSQPQPTNSDGETKGNAK
ncbi:hypothetical protein SEA_HIRKO_14 [Arthrobacter phage Hirko]|nr:hypothetical protein SEA_HIRKO_14 [Arthrobacter phage Hirko]